MAFEFDASTAKAENTFDPSTATPEKPASAARKLGDLGLSVAKGVVAVPETAVGLADLVSGGRAGKYVEESGVRFKDAKNMLSSYQSDDYKGKQKQFNEADGFIEKTGVALQNPSLISNAIAESVPMIGAGGVGARALMAAAPKVIGPVAGGALGEGVTGAGAAAEGIRQETPDGLLTGEQAALAGASGGATALFGAVGGKVANKMGIADADTALAAGTLQAGARGAEKGIVRRAAEGALSEGVLEELPQSLSEQALQNVALGKDWTQDLDAAAAMGLLSGGAMGAGMGALSRNTPPPPAPVPPGPNLALDPSTQLSTVQSEEMGAPNVPQATPPDGRAVLNAQQAKQQQERDAQLAAQRAVESPDDEILASTGALTPAAQMGIKPEAGPLSRVAAGAVDGGIHDEIQQAQAVDQDQAAYDAYMAQQEAEAQQQDTANQAITQGPLAEAQMSEEDKRAVLFSNKVVSDGGRQYEGTQDGDILNGMAAPFATRMAAARRARMEGAGWTIAPVFDGFVARRKDAFNDGNQIATEPRSTEPAEQDGDNAAASVEFGQLDRQPEGDNPIGAVADSLGQSGEQAGGQNAAPVAQGKPQPTSLGKQLTASAGPGFTAKDVLRVENPAPASNEPTGAQATADTTPQAVGADSNAAEPAAGAGSAQVEANGVGPASLGSVKADMDHLFGIPQKRAKAIERIAAGKAWFGNAMKAGEFLAKNGLKETHKATKTSATRWDIVAKQEAPVAPADAAQAAIEPIATTQGKDNGTQTTKAKPPEAQQSAQTTTPVNGASELVKVRTVYGENVHVLKSDMDSDKVKLRMFHGNGKPAMKSIHRDNLDPDGKRQAENNAADTDNPLNNVIGTKSGGAYATRPKAIREISVRGIGATHEAVAASELKPGANGFVIRRKSTGTADDSPVRNMQTANAPAKPEIVTDKAEMRPYRKPDGSVGYEAVPNVDKKPAEPAIPKKLTVYRATNSGRGIKTDAIQGGTYYFDNKEAADLWAGDAGNVVEREIETSGASIQDVSEGELIHRGEPVLIRRDPEGSGKILEVVVFDEYKQNQPLSPAKVEPVATETVAKPAQTVESVARAVRQKIAANRRKAREKSRKEYEAKGWKPNSTPESEQADYDTEVNAKLSEYSEKYAAALLGDNPLPLIEMFVNGNFEASEDVFKDITGVKIRGLSAADKKAALYKWAKWTPEQIAKAESDAKERTDRAAEKNKQEDAKTRVMGEWLALSRLQIGEPGQKGMDGQEFVLQAVAKGYDKAHSQKKGIATIYGLTNGKEFTTLKKGAFTDFVKAAIAFGGLDKTLEYVNPPMPQKPAGFVDRSIETGKDAGMIAKAFAPTESESKAPQAPAEPTPAATENVAKPDAKAVLSEREKAAKAKMFNALGKLATLAGKNTRMNWTQEEEQQLLPIVIELFDGAMELGAVTFQQAVAYVREFISTNLDQETADSIPFDTLQGAYISVAGRHKDKGVTSKKEVVSFDSLEELGTPEPTPADTVVSAEARAQAKSEGLKATEGISQWAAKSVTTARVQTAILDSLAASYPDGEGLTKLSKDIMDEIAADQLAKQPANADTPAKETTVTVEDAPKESLLGANDDTRRNATNDSEPLEQALPGTDSEDGQGGSAEAVPGVRKADATGNGRIGSGGPGRGNSLDGSEKPVLPSTPAEIRPLADGPVGKTEDRPQQLSGENPGNFVITDEFKLGQGTDGDKISGNLAAIRTLRQIQKEHRYPTKAEQTIMARYVGWGGLKTVFDPKKADATDQYGKAQRELKSLLSPDEYRAANGSIRNAHYTAEGIVDGMWRVMRFMGFKGGRSLEPTVGIGNFIGRMPADMAASTEWHASELDTTTGQLAAMLYPEANILASTGFQDAPFADGAFDISVGNPPFGAQTILDKSPNRKHLNGQKIHNYIIAKAGMHLRPGGVMSMVVTHRFLDTANPEARDVLAKDFRFLGAFRLPNDAFKKNAGTDVVTDVVFLQKLGAEEKRERDASWLDVNGSIAVDGQPVRVNRYYQDNPSHILGRSAMDGSMQRNGEAEYTVHSDGRDIGKAIDELMQTGFKHMAGALEQSNNSKALAPAMLTQSDLPIGGVMVNDEGKIVRRELNDGQGNAVVQEITPETLWKDQAIDWQALHSAVLDVRTAAKAGKVTQDDANEVLALSRFLFKADGTPFDKPTKAVEAVYKLVEDLAKPAKFQWSHDGSLLLITGALNRKRLGEDGYRSLKGMLDLRNRTLRLIRAEQSGDAQMEDYRADLNKAYDAFVKENGYLSDSKNANLLEGDVGAEAGIEANYVPAVSPAVAKSSGTPARAASAKKSDIMSSRVNYPYKEITHADSAADALFASISEHGKVDLPYMAKITNKSVQSVIEDLTKGENPQLFRDPETGEYQEAERYLSGNVKHKLQLAMERGMEANIKALEKSLPADKTKDQVKPNIRGMWMPPEIFTEFLQAIGYQDAKISVIASQGMLQASGDKLVMADFGVQFRHGKRTPMDMFNSQAAGKPIIITYTSAGSTLKDEQGTKEVNALAERMGKVFQEWAYADDNRVKRIVDAFNQNMNTHTPRTFDGVKYLKPVGASPSVVLRRTQLDGAWRMMQEKTMLADHVVGAGKTFTLITGIMERRRMGLSRKPMVVVPNHLVTQWARDFYKLYPGAKVLAANPADFAKKNRRRLLARIATGDYDAVIVGHTSIGFMETPTDDLKAIVDEKLAGLKEALAQARLSKESNRTLGQIEDRIDRYEQRLKDLAERPTDDIGIDFKALGIDHLSVDEAHEFKNLEYSTSGDRVVGMNDPNGSKKAFDLYSKVRGLLARGGGVTFATGTPVSNSLVEIYTMMSYLAHDELVLRGQEHFDSWSGAYAATETRLEYTATQKLKPRRVLAGLNNLSALRQLYEQFADIITMADLKRIYTEEMEAKNRLMDDRSIHGPRPRTDFPIPKVANGKRELIAGDITPAQKEYMDYLVARMGQIEQKKSDKEYMRIDNALNVLTDARKMSLDIRIVDPGAKRDENGKVATAAKNIKATYDKWEADRGTQLVFCDLSTPAKTAAKDARSIISETILRLYGKDLAKQVKKQLEGETFEQQWKLLTEKAEEMSENPDTSEEKRDAIAEYMGKIEDPEATMNVADIGFSVYDDLKSVLMDSGIPESEIAFIHDYNTPEQKEKLFDRVNNGYVRVLIGSSAKMGAGTNAQRRLVGLHHMDAPWRPSDVEQREGRIIRQGNMLYERDPDGFEVEIKAYSTNQTSDTVMWQILQRKAGAIEQFRNGGLDSMEEEGGDSDQYAEFMATSTGNPVFRQKLEAERRLTEIESEIGGALIVRSNAQSFLESYDRRRKAAQLRQEATQSFDPSTASYGGESGTQAEFEAAMKVANDDYLAKYAVWTQKNAAADLAIAKWETEPEATRGDKPSKPTMPSQPDLYTKSVQSASGYARAIGMALNEAGIDKTAKVSMAKGSILITGQTIAQGAYWTAYASNMGEQFTLDSSGAQKASASTRIIQALTPFSISNALKVKATGYERDVADLDRGKAEALKGSKLEVDTSQRDAARVELNWFTAQVAFAEVQADIDRGASKNRYIERDKRRNISQTQAVALTEPVTHTIDGVKYTTTGLLAYAGYQNVSQATRDSDGVPAIIVKQDKGGERTYAVAVQPEKLRKASKSTNLKQTGAPEGNTSNVVFSRPRFSRGAQSQANESVERLARGIASHWENPPKVVIAFDMDDPLIPESVRKEDQRQRSGGATGTPEGFYYKGTVYLMSSKLGTPNDIARVLFHEALGHYGLRGTFGKALRPILRDVAMLRRAEVDAKIKQYGLKMGNTLDRFTAAEEVLAELAQTKPEIGFVQRAIAAIRTWLRQNVPGFNNMRLSDNELIQNYILPARAFVEQGGGGGPKGGLPVRVEPTFSRGTNESMTNKDVVGNQGGRSADDTTPGASFDAQAAFEKHGGNGDVDESTDISAKSNAFADMAEADGYSVAGRGDKYVTITKSFGKDSDGYDKQATIKVRISDHSNVNRGHHFGDADINIAPDDGYSRDTFADAQRKIKSAYVNDDLDTVIPNEPTAPDSGGAMFSRSLGDTLASATNNVRDVALPAGYKVNDLIGSVPGKLNWWHKTVGTQYNLAQRSPAFKRVFDSVQSFINDVSYFATEAADLAPTILPKLESWKDITRAAMTPEDTKALSAPVFEGTLTWARDKSGKPVKVSGDEPVGIVFTPSELKSLFNLTDKQVGLYQEFRKATDKSLANMAIADMLRFGGKDVAPIRDVVLESKTVGEAAETLRDYLLSLAEGDERSDVLTDTANKMIEKGEKVQGLMDRGYAPLSRFGTYTLDVVDASGERAYFGMFESAAEASKMRRKMDGLYPGAAITQGTVSEQAYKMFAGVSPETLELFGDMLGLEAQGDNAASQAFQEYLKLAKSSRSAMKRMIQRKGIAGFSEDAGRVLAGFVYSNARQSAKNLHMGEMTEAASMVGQNPDGTKNGEGELKDAAVQLVDYIQNPMEEAQAIRGLMFAQYIGGSVASAMVNLTQPITMTFPWLSQYGGGVKAAKQMTAAMQDALKARTGNAQLDAAIKRAEEDGTVSPQEVHQLMQQSQGKGALRSGDGTRAGNALATAQNGVARVGLAWGKLFGVAEQFNRRVTFIAAFRTAVAEGMADPDAFARKAISETQGIYNKGNKPKWARGAIGATLFTFKQYSISYVEMLSRMAKSGPEGRKAAVLALAVLFLMAGAGGMPGADDLDDLLSGVLQSLGYNFDSKAQRKAFFVEVLGEGGAQFMEHGISGLPGMPIDVSGRMGLGNLLPGTGLFTKKVDHTSDVAELLGPVGDLAKRGFQAAGQALSGDVVAAVNTASPVAVRNLTKAYDMANMGMYRDQSGKKVIDTSAGDAIAKAIGFQPNDVKRVQDANLEKIRMIGQNKMRESEIADQWALGIFEKDKEKVRAARETLAKWNETNPESPIRIKFSQVLGRVKQMNMTKEERIAKTAPAEIRASVRKELAAQ